MNISYSIFVCIIILMVISGIAVAVAVVSVIGTLTGFIPIEFTMIAIASSIVLSSTLAVIGICLEEKEGAGK